MQSHGTTQLLSRRGKGTRRPACQLQVSGFDILDTQILRHVNGRWHVPMLDSQYWNKGFSFDPIIWTRLANHTLRMEWEKFVVQKPTKCQVFIPSALINDLEMELSKYIKVETSITRGSCLQRTIVCELRYSISQLLFLSLPGLACHKICSMRELLVS